MNVIQATTDRKFLPLFEALASEVRLTALELLSERTMNVKELAAALGLSSAIVTMHIRKLEQAGLIETAMVRRDGGTHKLISLNTAAIEIALPTAKRLSRFVHEVSVPVGHYTQFDVYPTCGLATRSKVIGQFDDPRYFLEPERMHAGILWFGKGYVEYRTPNYLMPGQVPEEIEISLEIGSEAPGINENWPSDIYFYLNGVCLGMWTCPGDFGASRGRFTPDWWMDGVNQYGLLKRLRVSRDGTFLDGVQISGVGLDKIAAERNQWTFRLAVPDDAQHVGGLTLYGEGFGNYNQDIVFRTYYSTVPKVPRD